MEQVKQQTVQNPLMIKISVEKAHKTLNKKRKHIKIEKSSIQGKCNFNLPGRRTASRNESESGNEASSGNKLASENEAVTRNEAKLLRQIKFESEEKDGVGFGNKAELLGLVTASCE